MPDNVIQAINAILIKAIIKQASDIHFEMYQSQLRIRFRKDGMLTHYQSVNLNVAYQYIARLKLMANLDIAEKRLPQDGRIQFHYAKQNYHFRISTCPMHDGEKVVLRILMSQAGVIDINKLGLLPDQKKIVLTTLHSQQGLILVTGPTGSGKTITLYSALRELNHVDKNIMSVEDPIEINIDGINQVAVNMKIGLDFARLLRAFLRQDPDIIMVGEIRDYATADIAVKAAQTGHLVLATLHTNSAAEAVIRLLNMGIKSYHLVSSLKLVIAQRLIRKRCDVGYSGRTGIFECLPIDEQLQNYMLKNTNVVTIKHYMKQQGWMMMRDVGMQYVDNQITDIDEINRVCG